MINSCSSSLRARVVAKTFCLDFLSVALALSSGVVFGGVIEGAVLSTACATLASGVGFQLARTMLRAQVTEQVRDRSSSTGSSLFQIVLFCLLERDGFSI